MVDLFKSSTKFFIVFYGFKSTVQCLKNSTECLKDSTVCFNTIAPPQPTQSHSLELLKNAVVHPTHQKDCKTEKSNYRPISIFQFCLKFTNNLYETKCVLHSVIFSVNINAAFRRNLVPNWKMKEARDNNKVCAAVHTDLSKAFDCLLQDLLIAKLHAFNFDLKSLRVIHADLNNRIQVRSCRF